MKASTATPSFSAPPMRSSAASSRYRRATSRATTTPYDTFTVTVKSGKRTDVKVEADAWQIALGYDYPLSKRTYLYAAASYVDRTYKENGKEVSGSKKTDTVRAAMLGICHSF